MVTGCGACDQPSAIPSNRAESLRDHAFNYPHLPLAKTTPITSVARRAQTQTNVRISLDIGYHTCVAYDGQQVSTLRSVYAKLPTGQKAPTLPHTYTVQFGGDRYLVGEGALTQRNYLPFANEDKLSAHLLKLALYALAGDGKVDLVVSHYSADEATEKLTAILEGTHTFTLDGDRKDLDVRRVTVLDEGRGSWLIAQQKGLIAPDWLHRHHRPGLRHLHCRLLHRRRYPRRTSGIPAAGGEGTSDGDRC